MTAIADGAGMLVTALTGVSGQVYTDLGASVNPPCIMLGPPALEWEGVCVGPTSARWLVYVIVPADERAMERLWELVEPVADAIDGTPAVVIRADPGVYAAGTQDLPCYEFQVEVSLL